MNLTIFGCAAAAIVLFGCGSDDEPNPAATGGSSAGGSGAVGAGGAGGEAGGGGAPLDVADAFLADFHASKYSTAAGHAAALDEAFAASPDDGRLALDRGLAHLWHVAEIGRDPNADPALVQLESAELIEQFEIAKEVAADDPRVGCFLGLTLVNAGHQLGSDEWVAEGLAVLDEAVAAYPEFNLFCVMLAYQDLPVTDPDFALALEAGWETMDTCFGESVDQTDPDITPYLGQATSTGEKRVCWNDPIAPHNAEGFYLYFGDLLVKQGDLAVARVMYENAQLIEEYPDWPYKSLIEDRLSADLVAKAALYQNEDPADDPLFGGGEIDRNCTYCHAATAEE